jgi:hypothetical protein
MECLAWKLLEIRIDIAPLKIRCVVCCSVAPSARSNIHEGKIAMSCVTFGGEKRKEFMIDGHFH